MNLYSKRWGIAISVTAMTLSLLILNACGKKKSDVPAVTNDVSSEVMASGASDNHMTLSDPMERLSGKFYIDGDIDAASVLIEPDGSFTACYASGTVEQEGMVRYESDESGYYVYVFYTDEGNPFMGFVDSGESKISEFETGNGSFRYVRVE